MATSRTLDIWLVSCDSADEGADYNQLSPAERQRADAFVFPEHRRRYVHAHAGLRQILGRYTGVAPSALRFSSGESGKPHLDNISKESNAEPMSFNLSHSGELAVVAVGGAAEIGVDIEMVRLIPDWEDIARMSFHPHELEWTQSSEANRRSEAFFAVWTAKEAYIKASGRGMSQSLNSFAVVGAATQQEYVIARLDLPSGYVGAVAYSPPACQLNMNRWTGS